MSFNSPIKKKKLDIISPVYNQETKIVGFIESLAVLDKEFVNVILVDDGSTDNTRKLIEEYISNLSLDNFYLIHKENGGAASARNIGCQLSISEYLWFFDPDDNLLINHFSDIKKYFVGTPEIIFFSYQHYDENSNSRKVYNSSIVPGDYSMKDIRNKLIHNRLEAIAGNSFLVYPWDKIIKRSSVSIFFNEQLSVYEDQIFNFMLINSVDGMVRIVPDVLYEYVTYSQSISLSNSWNEKKTMDFVFFISFLKNMYNGKVKNLYSRDLLSIIYKTPLSRRFSTIFMLQRKLKLMPNFLMYKTYTLKLVLSFFGVKI